MPVQELKAGHPAIARVLLTGGCGAALGIASCWLAWSGLGDLIPRNGLAWLLSSHVGLGCIMGADPRPANWWARGGAFGLLFGLPSAFALHALGLRSTDYGLAALAEGVVCGLLLAFLARELCGGTATVPPHRHPSPGVHPKAQNPARHLTSQRLAEEKACLDRLAAEREGRGDPTFGQTAEQRIVWKELLDLELQAIDEEVDRLRRAAGAAGPSSGQGSLYERNSP